MYRRKVIDAKIQKKREKPDLKLISNMNRKVILENDKRLKDPRFHNYHVMQKILDLKCSTAHPIHSNEAVKRSHVTISVHLLQPCAAVTHSERRVHCTKHMLR